MLQIAALISARVLTLRGLALETLQALSEKVWSYPRDAEYSINVSGRRTWNALAPCG